MRYKIASNEQGSVNKDKHVKIEMIKKEEAQSESVDVTQER